MVASGGARRLVFIGWTLAALMLTACASPSHLAGPAEVPIPAGRYAAAFDAARESLIDLGFELDRIDARHGIIRTFPKSTVGAATPWHREQSTPEQELEDLLNRQFRRATVTFHLPGTTEHAPPRPQTAPSPALPDLREAESQLVARIEVTLERLHRPGWRLEPSAMRFSSRSFDPDLRGRGMWPQYTVAFSQDASLAQRLATDLTSRMGAAQPAE